MRQNWLDAIYVVAFVIITFIAIRFFTQVN